MGPYCESVPVNFAKLSSTTTFRSIHQRCSIEKMFFKIFQYSQENTCVGISFSWSCRPSGLQLYWKGCLTQVFSVNITKFIIKTYFEEHLPMAASILSAHFCEQLFLASEKTFPVLFLSIHFYYYLCIFTRILKTSNSFYR